MKKDYPPLLPDGRNLMSINDFKTLCVDSFQPNSVRLNLFNDLNRCVLIPLSFAKTTFNIWINGSFLTKKQEPGDIDLVIEPTLADVPEGDMIIIESIFKNVKNEVGLDAYFFSKFVRDKEDYWDYLFSHGRDGSDKGYVLIVLKGGNVWATLL